MKLVTNIINNKYGRLTVLQQYGKDSHNKIIWLCKCDCGNEKTIIGAHLKNGNTRSCGCLKKENLGRAISKDKGVSGFNSLFSKYKRKSKKRNLEFKITKTHFKELTSSNCYYCGKEPSQYSFCPNVTSKGRIHGQYLYNGIDRVDNNLGYVFDNVVACCKICNFSKGTLSYDKFLNHIENMYKHIQREKL